MKRFSVGLLLSVIALIAATSAWFVSHRENLKLHSEIARLNDVVTDTVNMVHHQQDALVHARIGGTLLYRMALSNDHVDLFEFIRTIPPESLTCWIEEMEKYPSVRLISFKRNRQAADGSTLGIEDCLSVNVLVKTGTLDVVDYVLHQGTISFEESSDPAFYTLRGDLPDWTEVKYAILPTGFERNQ